MYCGRLLDFINCLNNYNRFVILAEKTLWAHVSAFSRILASMLPKLFNLLRQLGRSGIRFPPLLLLTEACKGPPTFIICPCHPPSFSFCKKERPYAMLPIQTHTNIGALSPTLINHVFQSSGVLLYLLVVMPVMLYLLNRCIISESRGSCLSLTLKVLHAWPQM